MIERISSSHPKAFQQRCFIMLILFSVSMLTMLPDEQQLFAQNAITSTPTPAPTKTEEPATTAQPTTTTPDLSVTFSPLTQADLSVVTGNVQRPNGLTWLNGRLYVSCTGDWTIYQLDDTTGQTQTTTSGIRNAHTLYAENRDSGEVVLWVPDFQTNSLVQVTRSGLNIIATNLEGPWGIMYFDEESFLVTSLQSNSVNRVTRTGELEPIITDLASPTGIAIDGASIYVANNGSTRRAIEWYTVGERTGDTPGEHAVVTGVQNVTGLAIGPDRYLYFAYSLGTRGVIGRVNPQTCRENGGCTGAEVEIVVLTELSAPLAGLTITPEMRIYIHSMFSPDIYWAHLPA
jgi:hypothetical protein